MGDELVPSAYLSPSPMPQPTRLETYCTDLHDPRGISKAGIDVSCYIEGLNPKVLGSSMLHGTKRLDAVGP